MVKELMDKAAKVSDAFDNIKGILASLSLIVMGVVVVINPAGKLDEIEIPHRERWGYAAAGFGLLFLLTIIARGKLKMRLSALMLLITASSVLVALVMWYLPQANDAYHLSTQGAVTEATVLTRQAVFHKKSSVYPTIVRYDNGGGATISLKSSLRQGTRVRVRYLPSNPKVAVPFEAGESTWDILTWRRGAGGLWAMIAIAAVAIISIPFNLANLFKPPSS